MACETNKQTPSRTLRYYHVQDYVSHASPLSLSRSIRTRRAPSSFSLAIPGAVSLALEGSWLSCGHVVIVMLWSCGSFYHALPNFRWQAGTSFMQFRAWSPVSTPMFMRLELPSAMPNFMWLELSHFHHDPPHDPHSR
jgi:hypothetical protein